MKVVDLNFKITYNGEPVLRFQFDQSAVCRDKIDGVINETTDPAGHKNEVHKGPLLTNVPLTEEKM